MSRRPGSDCFGAIARAQCSQVSGGCLALLLMLSSPAPAQDTLQKKPQADLTQLDIDELATIEVESVFGASKYLQKVTEAPASVSIVTADDIRRYGYRDIGDVLASVRGFYATNDRNYGYVGVRGFNRPGDYSTRILILVDGHRLNENIYDSPAPGTDFPINLEAIDRVEVIRGPSSSLYGSSAFFAVVNVVTKRGSQVNSSTATGEIASLRTHRESFTYGHQFGDRADIFVAGELYRTQGQRRLFFPELEDPATNNGVAVDADADRRRNVMANVSIGGFAVQGVYSSRRKTVPTGSFGTIFGDPRANTLDERGYLDVAYERAVYRDIDVSARIYLDHYRYAGEYPYEAEAPPFSVLDEDLARGNWWGTEIRAAVPFLKRHKVIGGFEYRNNYQQELINYDDNPFVLYLDERSASTNSSVYIQDEVRLGKRLLAHLGVRHDNYPRNDTNRPRLGAIYNVTPNNTVKVLYGEAFRAPNVYELTWQLPNLWKTNPDLTPELIRATEVIVEQYFARRWRAGANVFRYSVRDLITQTTDPDDGLVVFRNIDAARASGIEFELEGKWPNGARGRVSYAAQRSRDVATGARLTNSPAHVTQVNVAVPVLQGRAFAVVNLQGMSNRRTLTGSQDDAHVLTNISILSHKLSRRIELAFHVYNLLGTAYGDPGAEEHRQDLIPQNGRTARLMATYRF